MNLKISYLTRGRQAFNRPCSCLLIARKHFTLSNKKTPFSHLPHFPSVPGLLTSRFGLNPNLDHLRQATAVTQSSFMKPPLPMTSFYPTFSTNQSRMVALEAIRQKSAEQLQVRHKLCDYLMSGNFITHAGRWSP